MLNISKKITSLVLSLCLFTTLAAGSFVPVYASDTGSLPPAAQSVLPEAPEASSVPPEQDAPPESTPLPPADSSLPPEPADASLPDSVPPEPASEEAPAASSLPESPETAPPAPDSQPEPVPESALLPAQEQAAPDLLALARTDPAGAAFFLNTIENHNQFLAALRSVLDLYYTENLAAQLAAFSDAVDARAADTLSNYASAAQEREIAVEKGFLPGEVLVAFHDTPARPILSDLADAHNAELLAVQEAPGGATVATAKISLEHTVGRAIEEFGGEDLVAYAQPNYLYEPIGAQNSPAAVSTNDPFLSTQWYLDAISMEGAWNAVDAISGTPVPIAVLDTGVSYAHPDVQANMDISRSTAFDMFGKQIAYSEPPSHGDWWHGTHVGGTITASTNNGIGLAGIASTATGKPIGQMFSVGVFTEYGGKLFATSAAILSGIQYSINQGARIVNMSLGHIGHEGGSDFATEAAIATATARGLVTIAAAGNESTNLPSFPSDFSNVISVMATKQDNTLASFSNFGPDKDIAAPGVEISGPVPGGRYGYSDGTSMSSPIVAGVAALVLYANPDLNFAQVMEILTSTATATGNAWGVVNAAAAVEKAVAMRPAEIRSIALNTANLTVYLGTPATLSASVTPAGSANQNIIWSSSNEEVATVLGGVVTGRKTGTAVITATLDNGRSATCNVTVASPVTGVRLSQRTVRLTPRQSITISALVSTRNNTRAGVTWRSSRPGVATVTRSGRITARRAGTARITATAENGKRATITVRVVAAAVPLQRVTLAAPRTMTVGATRTLAPKAVPSTSTGVRFTYKSSRPSVLQVDAAGRLTAKRAGTARITVTARGKRATVTIRVVARRSR